MKNFFNDYVGLYKESFRFYKKHPVGTIVVTIIGGIVGCIIGIGIPALKEKIEEKRNHE